jgi:hypothetical protein
LKSAYIAITFYLDTTDYSALFMLAAVMEVSTESPQNKSRSLYVASQIPTFHLGLSTLYPSKFRNDAIFLMTFFLTRILFHTYLITSFALPPALFASIPILSSLGIGTGADLLQGVTPGLLFVVAFPMHVMWFVGGLKGHLRRRNARTTEKQADEAVTISKGEQNPTEQNQTTDHTPSLDPSPSLSSASPGDTPLLTPHIVASTTSENDLGLTVGYFPPLSLAGVGGVAEYQKGGGEVVLSGTEHSVGSTLMGLGRNREQKDV